MNARRSRLTLLRTGYLAGIAAMALLAAAKLTDEMLRLVWRSDATAAIDLRDRHLEVHGWFAGIPVYYALRAPTYPPATQPMLWPLLGWMSFETARWVADP